MEQRYRRGFLILLALLLLISCRKDEPTATTDHSAGADGVVVYETDTTDWRVCVVATGLLYAEAVAVHIPAPYRLPTKDDAQILKTLTYPSSERFVTSDCFSFAMPSASVTKAGAKTKYSVLALHIRKTTIDVPF